MRYLVYVIVHAIFTFLQYHIVWRLNGTLKKLADSQCPENYDKSAQVLHIIFTHRYDIITQPLSLVDFFLVHECFDHPERVLKDNVDIYYVDEKQAVFTEAEEGVQQWRSEYGAFMDAAQHQQAIRVIILPMHAASRLSEKMGDPKAQLIFLSTTARCGGTLLAQVFEKTGKCVVFSGSGGILGISIYEQQKMPKEKLDKITRSLVRLYCKPVKSPEEVVAYVFKPLAQAIDSIPAIHRVYPNAKHLFCYRDVVKTVNAIQKLRNVSPLYRVVWWEGRGWAFFMKPILKMFNLKCNATNNWTHPVEFALCRWALAVRKYLDMRQQGIEFAGFLYEDLIKNKQEAIRKAFKFARIPMNLVDVGMRALDKDSQEGSGGSTTEIVHYVNYELQSFDLTKLINNICKKFGLPKVNKDFRLDGTISTVLS